jgi:uridine phosphorylase
MVKPLLKSLNIIRIGTSGAVQQDISIGSIMVSEYGVGLDSLMQYYMHQISGDEHMILDAIKSHFHHFKGISPYITAADPGLIETIGKGLSRGITVTAPGFYAPQGRKVRAKASFPGLIDDIRSFKSGKHRITNLEMETAGIYALSKLLGHNALSVNAILASRLGFEFSTIPEKIINQAIELVLSRL